MPKKKEMKFNDALVKLERAVKRLEEDDLDLEDFIDTFAEGLKCASICQNKLNESKRKIDVVIKKFTDTSNELQPFDESETSSEE